ncbi:HPP family protein [compost metagenome]
MAGAAACALMVMMATDTVHPPAGSNPIIIFMSHADWTFLAFPTLAGALLLLLAQRIYRGVVRQIAQE